MNDAMKKLLIPVAVILVAALVLFAATAGLAGTASANEQAKLDEILGYMIPGRRRVRRGGIHRLQQQHHRRLPR